MFRREFVLITPLSEDQIAEALRGKSEQSGKVNQPIAALFKAESIEQDGFHLQLLAEGGLGYRPSLRGTLDRCSAGTKVTVIASLSDPFSVVWSVALGIAALMALGGIRSLSDLPLRLAMSTLAATMVVTYWWVTARMFDTGVLTASSALKDTLKAEIDAPGR
jgi:hypothetical protein